MVEAMANERYHISKETRAFVVEKYTQYTNHELAKLAGISESSVQKIRKAAGLSKPNTGCFRKNNRPWNFRTKGVVKSTPGMARTQFKKGFSPSNTLQDGAITIRLDHPKDRNGRPYQWIRLSMSKWVMFHRWLWEQTNGPVPKGHVIVFKDGDTMNCDIRNLKCITMQENLRRNYNREKAASASKNLTDNYIAGRLAGGDKGLRRALIHATPELIRAKRTELQLKRQIKQNEKHNQA